MEKKINHANWELAYLWRHKPDKALELCRAALRKTNGNVYEAAPLLGISYRSLYRWIDRSPELREEFVRRKVNALTLRVYADALGIDLDT